MSIGIVMPAFNAERHIADALSSLLREAALGLEIVVVDDGSTDGTAEIVKGMADRFPEIRLVRGEHRGVAAARNLGLREVLPRHPLITFLDADDLSYPARLARQAGRLGADSGVMGVIGNLQLFEEIDPDNMLPRPGTWVRTVRGISLTTLLVRREVFDQLGLIDEDFDAGEDADFILRMLEANVPYRLEDEIAVLYRRHETNMTSDHVRVRRGFLHALHKSAIRREKLGIKTLPPYFTKNHFIGGGDEVA
jgi:glycosyltransferase involved in cell wall biosynthesis